MKIKKSILQKIIREEAGQLFEGCPANDLPCPFAAADELRASGASPEELLSWVATLTQELVAPGGEDPHGEHADAEGVQGTLDGVSDPMSAPLQIAFERRNRRRAKKLSSRQVRSIIESVVGPGDLIRRPKGPVLPKKNKVATKRRLVTCQRRR
jgi:hypothetical protein